MLGKHVAEKYVAAPTLPVGPCLDQSVEAVNSDASSDNKSDTTSDNENLPDLVSSSSEGELDIANQRRVLRRKLLTNSACLKGALSRPGIQSEKIVQLLEKHIDHANKALDSLGGDEETSIDSESPATSDAEDDAAMDKQCNVKFACQA